MSETINHPPHYNQGSIEVITVIEDWDLNFCLGNAVKYIARSKHKGSELEDLKKAAWYLDREIKRLEATKFLNSKASLQSRGVNQEMKCQLCGFQAGDETEWNAHIYMHTVLKPNPNEKLS